MVDEIAAMVQMRNVRVENVPRKHSVANLTVVAYQERVVATASKIVRQEKTKLIVKRQVDTDVHQILFNVPTGNVFPNTSFATPSSVVVTEATNRHIYVEDAPEEGCPVIVLYAAETEDADRVLSLALEGTVAEMVLMKIIVLFVVSILFCNYWVLVANLQ